MRSSRQHRKLEARLRGSRPEPRREFVAALAATIAPVRHRGPARRIAFTGALTTALLVALGAVGGIGYAASAGHEAVHVVKQAFAPSGKKAAVAVSGISSGGDQYRPGYGWGDKNHNHSGPPGLKRRGGAFAPPEQARLAPDGRAYLVTTSITIDEQAALRISVIDASGKELLLTQSMGAKVGSGIKGPQSKVLRYTVLVPRSIPIVLRIPRNLVKPGGHYRIRVIGTSPQGTRTVLLIPFTIPV